MTEPSSAISPPSPILAQEFTQSYKYELAQGGATRDGSSADRILILDSSQWRGRLMQQKGRAETSKGRPDIATLSLVPGFGRERPSNFETVLLAIAGHDLRQPLQAIQGTHDLLGRGVRTPSEIRLLDVGRSAVDRLKCELDQLIAALRIGHAASARLIPVEIGPLMRQVCRESEACAFGKTIDLRLVCCGSAVRSDPLLLGAILRNLITNAVKYTEPGGRILVGCRRIGNMVRIDVYDTGIGIEADQIASLFEPFACLDPCRRDSVGLGLFIVREAAELLGHRLEIASAPLRGSRFSVSVPRA